MTFLQLVAGYQSRFSAGWQDDVDITDAMASSRYSLGHMFSK